ncbi:Ulp1 protease family, C-terminal catalytic domain [Sesbania bispinosa]|nr:Ulp1 protease family, C-terminal catalytic domain [Sesbania bispinosa]
MAGHGKTPRSRAAQNPPRKSPRLIGQRQRQLKLERLSEEEVIEISSSCHQSDEKETEKSDNLFQVSKPPEEPNHNEGNLNSHIQQQDDSSRVDQLKELVKLLANVIVNNNTVFSPNRSAQSLHLLATSCLSPLNSTATQSNGTDIVMQEVSDLAERLTQSAPPRGPGTSQNVNQLEDTSLARKLFIEGDNGQKFDHYINFNPLQPSLYDGRKTGVQIPHWMLLSFRPPEDMELDDVDAIIAAYIFKSETDYSYVGNEVLIKCSWGSGDRAALKTLMPKTFVLNLLASKLTDYESRLATHSSTWFFPTTFSQYALEGVKSPQTLMGYYQAKFMGKINYVRKIFVPINDENLHWYLMVVDLNQKKIVMLDSLPYVLRNGWRKRYVKKLAMFIEEMLLDPSFYDRTTMDKPIISDFPIEVPHGLGYQHNGYDCGVWVAMWMTGCVWRDGYNKIVVTPHTRMRLAIDLVQDKYNYIKYDVINLAVKHWSEVHAKRSNKVKI